MRSTGFRSLTVVNEHRRRACRVVAVYRSRRPHSRSDHPYKSAPSRRPLLVAVAVTGRLQVGHDCLAVSERTFSHLHLPSCKNINRSYDMRSSSSPTALLGHHGDHAFRITVHGTVCRMSSFLPRRFFCRSGVIDFFLLSRSPYTKFSFSRAQ
jgi:hypothetical protein